MDIGVVVDELIYLLLRCVGREGVYCFFACYFVSKFESNKLKLVRIKDTSERALGEIKFGIW